MTSLSSFAEKRFGKQVWHVFINDYGKTNIQAFDNSRELRSKCYAAKIEMVVHLHVFVAIVSIAM